MKVMILSDLHLNSKYDVQHTGEKIRQSMSGDVEAVVICGDIFEYGYECNPYGRLHSIFKNDVPVICVLGNHEFFGRTIQDTLALYKKQYKPKKYDVHYLDIVGHYDIGSYRFFGNVLWYDGSMSTIPGQNPNIFLGGEGFGRWLWMDHYIVNFDCRKANADCIAQIKSNKGDESMINVLCTHTCPDKKLNLHMTKINSPYNAFSGVGDFLADIRPDYSFCGHTHWRTVGQEIHGCKCVNVGSDLNEFRFHIMDI